MHKKMAQQRKNGRAHGTAEIERRKSRTEETRFGFTNGRASSLISFVLMYYVLYVISFFSTF